MKPRVLGQDPDNGMAMLSYFVPQTAWTCWPHTRKLSGVGKKLISTVGVTSGIRSLEV